ncbi:MAG: NAD(P)-dependent alcohol dehydrogenase [Anaerolineales bacterium]|nr:NAD(P)-dependent alcohol dehydrogenase [Anaerolineales bacterium]
MTAIQTSPTQQMQAIVSIRSGPPEVLQLQEVAKPAPKANEVLIRVHAATVTVGDVMLRKLPGWMWLPMRLLSPHRRKRIPGHELAGEVVEIGNAVTRFAIGDQVFGTTTGLSVGANAEYVCVPETWPAGVLARKPANLSYAEAAALPVGGMTALQLLRKGKLQAGHAKRVLIYGASGSVGSMAVQLARHLGAEVTGVSSGANAALVRSLGAQHVVDYTKEDFTELGETYDLIFDAVGKGSAARSKRALKPGGRYISVATLTRENTDDLNFIRELAEAGAVKAVIDRRYPLAQAADAHRYVETGRKRGSVVLTIEPSPSH